MKYFYIVLLVCVAILSCNSKKNELLNRQKAIATEMRQMADSLKNNLDYNTGEPYNYQERGVSLEKELDSINRELKK